MGRLGWGLAAARSGAPGAGDSPTISCAHCRRRTDHADSRRVAGAQPADADDGSRGTGSDPLSVGLTEWWVGLAVAGLGLSYLGGFFLLWFACFDDHVKQTQRQDAAALHAVPLRQVLPATLTPLHPPRPIHRRLPGVQELPAAWVYLHRTFGWALACLPCTVVWLSAKLSCEHNACIPACMILPNLQIV